ncbi:hypothetical protein DMN91_001793 [Ooceraea biroi]|uniref:BESS domain-containing protein n=2 Tax=Ooceraea biroi TaxID=2015173 RepID=A0A3L8DZ61_OOCBI|nr:hypothetical protein DMN91_001793 [Ooceraea biroi]
MVLMKRQELSGSGRDDVSYKNLLSPQSKAIHRFMSRLYIPRKTVSNYTNPSSTSSSSPSFACESKCRLPSSSSLVKQLSQSILSAPRALTRQSPKDSPIHSFLWNQEVENISEMPASDMKKRKKTDLEEESLIKQSSQAIATACSALPILLNRTTSKVETEEDKDMITVLLYGFKRVPVQQKTKCMIKLLETLESFNKTE